MIAPVTDEPDADDDGSKRLGKGKEKGKHKSRKGLKESKEERVPISEHDGEAALGIVQVNCAETDKGRRAHRILARHASSLRGNLVPHRG